MTIEVTLTSTPVLISTGAKSVHLTVNSGSKPCYAVSATLPNKAAFHVLHGSVMNIGEGFSVWMWDDNSYPIKIAYSEAT